jgi:hypothetical protein
VVVLLVVVLLLLLLVLVLALLLIRRFPRPLLRGPLPMLPAPAAVNQGTLRIHACCYEQSAPAAGQRASRIGKQM